MIPFLDLKSPHVELHAEIQEAVNRVISSGWFILGPEVDQFEAAYAAYCDAKHCVGLANGLDALHLSLLALGVGPGDEVIVPSNTYVATWLAVSQCGATPIPVEPDQRTHNIDPALIGQAITSRTKVILPVHLYGQPADMDAIMAVARQHGLAVLEDAAQAHGATYKGRPVGAHGDVVAWSFYPGKNLGALGDGGGITTSNDNIADKVRVLRNYGSRQKYVNEVKGYNSRLDPIHAAVLGVKLGRLTEWNRRRSVLAQRYLTGLQDLDLTLPDTPDWAGSAWHNFVVRTPQRTALQDHLLSNGVGTLIHYPIPPHLQQAYASMKIGKGSFPIAEKFAAEVLSLPMGPHISHADADTVIQHVRSFFSSKAN
ncbi:DegT/DnrJ/EryC1/StrS family aminotransferase [Paucibacter sp. XJ19-41]|uniref:DegT/DnrJ/EryC1/StrS family aminotransferase n=1 Tax=Paucibacter sp. XJ19-41 TaxID=2927824 RepID=UPI002349CF04|nr:DegT/DnrJ/EryC1/StrS family aminotransferase [Paucibacter sp. XJ19-41]MDC6166177.1 DegT/DnrJ/EryC1/StrS family aminotransferase [Paucibacter sp. XJ19-41]